MGDEREINTDYNVRCKQCGNGFAPTNRKQLSLKVCKKCMKEYESRRNKNTSD